MSRSISAHWLKEAVFLFVTSHFLFTIGFDTLIHKTEIGMAIINFFFIKAIKVKGQPRPRSSFFAIFQ